MSITQEEINQRRRDELWAMAEAENPGSLTHQLQRYDQLLRAEWNSIPNPWGGA